MDDGICPRCRASKHGGVSGGLPNVYLVVSTPSALVSYVLRSVLYPFTDYATTTLPSGCFGNHCAIHALCPNICIYHTEMSRESDRSRCWQLYAVLTAVKPSSVCFGRHHALRMHSQQVLNPRSCSAGQDRNNSAARRHGLGRNRFPFCVFAKEAATAHLYPIKVCLATWVRARDDWPQQIGPAQQDQHGAVPSQ
jgi:hypothetical protein